MNKTRLFFSLLSFILFLTPLLYASNPVTESTGTIFGCTNPLAKNFNPLAQRDNGTCVFENTDTIVWGCTNPEAKNFNPLAQRDNGTCIFGDTATIVIYGCTNPRAKNFNPLAQKDNGTCVFGDVTTEIYGCTNPKALNYNSKATIDNRSCIYDSSSVVYGCKDPSALNFNAYANISNNNCIYKTILPGCTDSLAVNYNASANINDGTCKYEAKIWGCTDRSAINFNSRANHDNGYCEYKNFLDGCMDKTAINYNPAANHDNRTCVYSTETTWGCTDPFALNFNPFAKKNNGSCIYEILRDTIVGCTDKLASNYNPIATKSNGKCIYDTTYVFGCNSPKALNFNRNAKRDDGSCIFARPVNTVSQVLNQGVIAIADTIGKILEASCNFDYSVPIDTVYIVKTKYISKSTIEIEWAIKQGDLITTVKTEYFFKKQGTALIYLSLVCNQGIGTTTTKAPTSQKVSSLATDKVKAVTVSSYYIYKIVSETSNPKINDYSVSVFPNPIQDQLNVTLNNTDNENFQLNIYSVDGRKLITTNVTSESGLNNFVVNTTTLKSGLHFITINKNGSVIGTMKFSKY